MESSRIRYLRQEEKQATRPMYESAFPEDSQEFVDYYYSYKTKDNEIIVMEGAEQDSSFHVMIHLNPYNLSIYGLRRQIPYIVAVATDSAYRRQGKMGLVMAQLLQDLASGGVPFTFLLPADPAYYRGQGFVFFPSQPYLEQGGICLARESGQEMLRAASLDFASAGRWRRASAEDAAKMAAFSNQVLERRCEVFISREEQYYRRLLAELAAEHGGALLSENNQGIDGLIFYSINRSQESVAAEIKELLLEENATKEEARQICSAALKEMGCMVDRISFTFSRMMVRLASLVSLVPLLRSERPIRYQVEVADAVIAANVGCFQIDINCVGGSIRRINRAGVREHLDITELTERLFRNASVYLHEWV